MRVFCVLILIVAKVSFLQGDFVLLDAGNTRVWGPGVELADKLPLNARYFYIEPRDGQNNVISDPLKYRVLFKGRSRLGECRVKIEQIDRFDGSSLIRYKLGETCWDMEIHVLHGEQHLGVSPYTFSGKLYTENCNCPQGHLDDWIRQIDCPTTDVQIESDLIPFRAVNFSSLRPRIIQQFDKPGSVSLCNYVVKDNRIYRTCYGRYTGFKMYMDALLLSMARKTVLPDMELFVNLGDWPLVTKGGHRRTTGPYPVFSWCGSEDTFDIVMPTYDIAEATLEAMNRVTLDMLSVQRKGIPWKDKEPKGFWRGRDSCRERLDLVGISQRRPDLVNASLTNFFFFRDEEKKYGPKVAYISFFDFFNYKYQINMDGTVAAYRLPYLLGGSSVVFKQASKYYEHFYSKLEKWKEYVPFKRDLSDLVESIEKAKAIDDTMLEIRNNAKAFVEEHLLPKSILCYYGLLFKEQLLPDVTFYERVVSYLLNNFHKDTRTLSLQISPESEFGPNFTCTLALHSGTIPNQTVRLPDALGLQNNFAEDSNVLCGRHYEEYAKSIVSSIQILPAMEQAEQPTTTTNCECDSEHGNHHDEL